MKKTRTSKTETLNIVMLRKWWCEYEMLQSKAVPLEHSQILSSFFLAEVTSSAFLVVVGTAELEQLCQTDPLFSSLCVIIAIVHESPVT